MMIASYVMIALVTNQLTVVNRSLQLSLVKLLEKGTYHWTFFAPAHFLHVLFDLLEALLLAVLAGHPQCALEPGQPRDGHVEAHSV